MDNLGYQRRGVVAVGILLLPRQSVSYLGSACGVKSR